MAGTTRSTDIARTSLRDQEALREFTATAGRMRGVIFVYLTSVLHSRIALPDQARLTQVTCGGSLPWLLAEGR